MVKVTEVPVTEPAAADGDLTHALLNGTAPAPTDGDTGNIPKNGVAQRGRDAQNVDMIEKEEQKAGLLSRRDLDGNDI